MAIAFDAVSSKAYQASSTTLSHTCTGSLRLLVVAFLTDGAETVSGTPTYAGSNMTSAGAAVTGTDFYISVWYKIAPATGANNISVTLTGSTDAGILAMSYTGVDQSSPFDNMQSTANDSASPWGRAITTAVANELVILFAADDDNRAAVRTPVASTNERVDAIMGSGAGDFGGFASDRVTTTAGSYTMTYTDATVSLATVAVLAFKEDTTGGAPAPSVSDSVTVTESVGRMLESFVSKSESTTVSEAVNATLVSNLAVSDSTTVSESVTVRLQSHISVSDSTTVSEATTLLIPTLHVNVTDSTTVSESVQLQELSFINKSDSVTVSESVALTISLNLAASDSTTVSESLKTELQSHVQVSDTATLTESTSLLIPTLHVSVSDSVTVSESVNRLLTSFVSQSDSITVSESLSVGLLMGIAVSDSVTVTEALTRLLLAFVSVSDTTTLSESVTVAIESPGGATLNISVSDSITVTDSPTVLRIEPDLGVIVTPGIQQVGGVRIV